jgi:hypothetical protein
MGSQATDEAAVIELVEVPFRCRWFEKLGKDSRR